MTHMHLALISALFPVALFTTPAFAKLGPAEDARLAMASQPAAYIQEAQDEARANCGKPEQIMIMLRDPTGAVVATASAEILATC